MKINLAKAVKICRTKKTTLQVLYRFAVRSGVLHLTDLDQTLLGACEAPDGLYVTDTFVKSGNLDLAREKGVDLAEFPEVPKIEKAAPIDASIFLDMAGFADFVSEGFSTRLVLTGVCLQKDTLVATDGHVLMAQTFPGVRFSGEAIIPTRCWRTVEKLKRISSLQGVDLGKTEILFHFRDFDYIAKLIEGPFPDFQRIFPKEHKKTTKLNRTEKDALAAALEKVERLTGDTGQVFMQGDFVFVWNRSTGIKAKARLGGAYWPDRTGFNCHYLVQCLRQHSAWVTLNASGAGSPTVFAGEGGRVTLVMPLRLDADDVDDNEYTEV